MGELLGKVIVFGIPARIKPIAGVPEGAKVRLKFREGQFAKMFVRHKDGTFEAGVIEIIDRGVWRLLLTGVNQDG